HRTSNPKVAGSIPAGRTKFCDGAAQPHVRPQEGAMLRFLGRHTCGRRFSSRCAFGSTLGPLVFVVAVGGCATASPSNPFGIPEEEFRAKVKRIALAPIAVPPRLGVPEPAKL